MSSTTGFSPAASARPCRSCTRSLRDAAISTSTSPTDVALGPTTQKSRLTSSSENGMYWLASDSTCSSSSSSRRPAGSMIFLVMTADCGMAITTFRVLVPLLLTTRFTASATSSNFSIWPSWIQPFSKLSAANRSRTYSPDVSCESSTNLTLDELMSSPIMGGCLRPNNVSRKLTTPSPIALRGAPAPPDPRKCPCAGVLAVKPLSDNEISRSTPLLSLRNADVFVTKTGAVSGQP